MYLSDEEQILLTAYFALTTAKEDDERITFSRGERLLDLKYAEGLSHLSRAAGPKPRSRRVERLAKAPSNQSRKVVVTRGRQGALA